MSLQGFPPPGPPALPPQNPTSPITGTNQEVSKFSSTESTHTHKPLTKEEVAGLKEASSQHATTAAQYETTKRTNIATLQQLENEPETEYTDWTELQKDYDGNKIISGETLTLTTASRGTVELELNSVKSDKIIGKIAGENIEIPKTAISEIVYKRSPLRRFADAVDQKIIGPGTRLEISFKDNSRPPVTLQFKHFDNRTFPRMIHGLVENPATYKAVSSNPLEAKNISSITFKPYKDTEICFQ